MEKKKVTVRKFKNMKLVDIREYYQKDGKWLPGSKGVSLTEEQWNALVGKTTDISEALYKIDDREEFSLMKAALDSKVAKENEEKEKQSAIAEAAKSVTNSDKKKDDEDDEEDIDDFEFEDVSESTDTKRVKTE